MAQKQYDLAIIGTGPAGYTASIYASRYKLQNILIGSILGGQTAEAHKICNFPSHQDISGIELITKLQKQAQNLGVDEIFDTVVKIKDSIEGFEITISTNTTIHAKNILLAIGTKRRKLCCKGEDKFAGKGVSYCATCDAMFYKNKTVAVLGGADAANTSSIYLSKIAKKVYQIYRKDKLRGDPTWIDQIMKNEKIKVIFNTNIKKLLGTDNLESLLLDKPYNKSKELNIDGLFVEIGSTPDTQLTKQLNVKTDSNGYIKVGSDQSTNITGVWAAGDITTNSNHFRQIITACAEGAIAAESIYSSIQKSTSK